MSITLSSKPWKRSRFSERSFSVSPADMPTPAQRNGRTYDNGSMAPSTALPIPSRTVSGSRSGKTRYGPGPEPQTASVCPKSSRLFSISQYFAASNSPPMPRVLLMRNRATSRPAPLHLPWSRLLAARLTNRMLSKPFEIEHPLVERLPGIVLLIELLAVRGRLPGGPLRLLRHDRRRPLGAVGADALLPIRWEPAPVGGDRGLIDASGAGEGPAPSEEQHENGERQEGCPAARVDDRDPRQTNPPVAPRMEFEKPATLYPGMPGVVLRIWTRVAAPDSRFLCVHAE